MTADCTIIIATLNRPHCLNRLLNYYNKNDDYRNIIIADSSNEKIKKTNKNSVSSCSNLNILYLDDFPQLTEFPGPSGQFLKLRDSLKHVDDKYCVTCSDDDFITPNGIKKSVEFLEKNPDFVTAQGQHLSFELLNDSNNAPHFYWNYSSKIDSNTHQDPGTRLLHHFSNYTLTIYSVHRTEIMKLVWEETTRTKNLGVFGELSASMLTSIYGKMKGLEISYNFREKDPTAHGRTAKKLYDYVSEGAYYEKYSRLKNCLSDNLSKEGKMSLKEAEKIVEKGWAEHTKRYKGFVSSKLSYMMRNMPLSSKFDEEIKKVYKKFRKNSNSSPQMKTTEEPSAEYLDDFKMIKNHIMENLKEEKEELETVVV